MMAHEKIILDVDSGELTLKNTNFIQFYEDNLDLLSEIVLENPTALRILLWLVKYMDNRGALVTSQVAICDALSIHRNTVSNAVSYLKSKKAIAVLKSGTTNIYAINEQIAWKETADKKKFAHFSAKVYLAGSEQDIEYQRSMFGYVTQKISKNKFRKFQTSKTSSSSNENK
jgi:DNA-binding transcriptional ArsR family regulator